jgi:hypothetical protein
MATTQSRRNPVTINRVAGKDQDVITSSHKPRSYLLVDLGFAINDYISLSARYEHGSLPPAYPFLRGKATIAITFALGTK